MGDVPRRDLGSLVLTFTEFRVRSFEPAVEDSPCDFEVLGFLEWRSSLDEVLRRFVTGRMASALAKSASMSMIPQNARSTRLRSVQHVNETSVCRNILMR